MTKNSAVQFLPSDSLSIFGRPLPGEKAVYFVVQKYLSKKLVRIITNFCHNKQTISFFDFKFSNHSLAFVVKPVYKLLVKGCLVRLSLSAIRVVMARLKFNPGAATNVFSSEIFGLITSADFKLAIAKRKFGYDHT